MGGKYGTENVKQVITTVKLASISMIQKLPEAGLSVKTLIAPIASPTFIEQLEKNAASFVAFLPELSELDMTDKIQLAKHSYDCWCDVKLEWGEAMKKIRMQKAKNATR